VHLNAFTDLGLRVLIRLAGAPQDSFSASGLSKEFKVSVHHLSKVIATMAKAGFVATRRGHAGGVTLARAANDITLGEVVRVMERKTALVECFRPDGGNCTLSNGCLLAGRLSLARQKFLQDLDRSTILDCAFVFAP